ncbi:MAG: tRNA 2-thiouridine(34) synthase MnmA [Rickettsiaceae bacterium]|nr:tRNA 2-thiouridine(34) synthase MnmA [Rickettsiaceae bacterium]
MFNFRSNKEPNQTKVVVAMSGGVDSSVVAARLAQEGFNVIGVTLQLYDQGSVKKSGACCAGKDIYDAKLVADKFGFPHYVLDYESRFKQSVIDDFADSYLRGETPLPCVRCNQSVKFHDLMEIAKSLGADSLATGHYVNNFMGKSGPELHKAKDENKDQSYFLFATTKSQLEFLQFPLGDCAKEETRNMALNLGLEIADKPDSQDICFVPNGSYSEIIKKIRPNAEIPGKFIHVDGYEMGMHKGIINYTIGQRRGIGISCPTPLYVVKIDPENNVVYLGSEQDLYTEEFIAKELNWIGDGAIPEGGLYVQIKTRSRHKGLNAKIYLLDDNNISVKVLGCDKAVTPGQACVLYDNTRVLGGGWISRMT